MGNGLELLTDVFTLHGFDEPHFGIQLVERLDAVLEDGHPPLLGSMPAEFEQFFNRLRHHLPRGPNRFRWRVAFPVGEKAMSAKFVQGYPLQIVLTLSL